MSLVLNTPLLAVTTSGPRAQIGLFLPTGDSEVLENLVPREHSEWLHVSIQQLLDQTHLAPENLGGIAIDLGPGSFTGLRVGFQLAQSLCFANQTPIFCSHSLSILAAGLPGHVVAAKNAFRNMVYTAEFQDGKMTRAIEVEEILNFQTRILKLKHDSPDISVVGDAFSYYQNQDLQLPTAVREHPDVEYLALSALESSPDYWTIDWKSLSPLYLRASEAEEKAKMK